MTTTTSLRAGDVARGRRAPDAADPAHPHPDRRHRDRVSATTRTCTTTRASPQERGSKDIFMNILTTNGFVGRYVTDWAGPDALLRVGAGSASAPRTTPATRWS